MTAGADAELPNPGALLAEFRAFERSLALRAALELDLFTRIDSGVDTVQLLATATGASERGIRILCDFLTVAGHLSKQSRSYSLPLNSRLYPLGEVASLRGIGSKVPRERPQSPLVFPTWPVSQKRRRLSVHAVHP